LDKIILERDPKTCRCWRRNQKFRCLEPEIWVPAPKPWLHEGLYSEWCTESEAQQLLDVVKHVYAEHMKRNTQQIHRTEGQYLVILRLTYGTPSSCFWFFDWQNTQQPFWSYQTSAQTSRL